MNGGSPCSAKDGSGNQNPAFPLANLGSNRLGKLFPERVLLIKRQKRQCCRAQGRVSAEAHVHLHVQLVRGQQQMDHVLFFRPQVSVVQHIFESLRFIDWTPHPQTLRALQKIYLGSEKWMVVRTESFVAFLVSNNELADPIDIAVGIIRINHESSEVAGSDSGGA